MNVTRRPVASALVATAVVALVAGCAAGDSSLPTSSAPTQAPTSSSAQQSPDVPVSSAPVTIVATRTASGGLCVTGTTCETVFTVSSDGGWTLVANGDAKQGALAADTLAAVVDAATTTQIADAPPFTGTCPIAYDGQEVVYSWTDDAGSTQTVSACERAVADDDPLVVALGTAQAEALTTGADDMDAQAARTQAIANSMLGRPEDEAVALIEGVSSMKLTARIVRRDAETFPVTEDYSPTRINLSIHAGIVTDATVG